MQPKGNSFIKSTIKERKAPSIPSQTPILILLFAFMSCFGPKKPLHPAKKVWIRLTAVVRKLRRSRPVATILPVRPSEPRFHVQHGKTSKRFHSRKSSHHRSFAPVYIDELFSRDATVNIEGEKTMKSELTDVGTCSSGKGEKMGGKMAKSEWPAVGTSSSSRAVGDLGEVDLRAEMFIARFKDGMRLERQRSFGEYHDMLARGV